MGDVVPFIAKVRSNGDWTAAERARLQEVADMLAAGGARVEAVFGATDAGDPWCVVTDENGEVLIHVARIDGKFVVHSAVDDALSEGADLHSALRERLDGQIAAEEDSAVVVPFSLGGRQAQTFLALVIATAFFYETVEFADAAEAAPAPPAETPAVDPPPPPLDIKTPTQERELAVQGAAFAEPAPARPALLAFAANVAGEGSTRPTGPGVSAGDAPQLASAPSAQPAEAIVLAQASEARTLSGTSGDDELIGTAADERLVGGDGDDTLRGGGGNDLLLGGAGDDRLELGAQVTAVGGAGADIFEIVAPQVLGRADTLLGVVADFSFADGDKLVWQGQVIPLAPPAPGPGPGAELAPPTAPTDFGTTGDKSGGGSGGGGGTEFELAGPSTNDGFGPDVRRVDVDFDGDGVNDGYVLVYAVRSSAGVGDPLEILPPPAPSDASDLFG